MARLLVFRGDFLEREIELGVTPIRLGRADECDVVLEDPDRGISRAHAEVRYERDGYVISDLGSQNGIYQYGARVDRAYFEPDSPITLGPFRLVVDESDGTSPGATSAIRQASQAASAERGGHDSGEYAADGHDERFDDSSVRRSRQSNPGWFRAHATPLWLGGAAVLVVGGLGLTRLLSSQEPTDEQRLLQHISSAHALLEQLQPQRALVEHIEPALVIDPANADAVALKKRAQDLIDSLASGSATPTESTPPPALPPDLPTRSPTAGRPPPPPVQSPADPRQSPRPSTVDPGLEKAPESQVRSQLLEAKQLIDRGQFANAETILQGIVQTGGSGFLEAKAMLPEIAKRKRQEGERLFREATEDAANDRFDDAIAKYRRAHEIDPTLVVASQIEDIQRKKLAAAEEKFKEADLLRKVGDNKEALRLYEQALKLFPPGHPRQAEIEARIKELRK